jgi:hypothetical protein
MIDAGIFPVNYFSVVQLSHFYPDAKEGIVKCLRDGQ